VSLFRQRVREYIGSGLSAVHRLHIGSPSPAVFMFSLKLFGGVSLLREGSPLGGPAAQRRRLALLSLLAASLEVGVSREKLIGYLWPETGSEQARRFLADSIYALRRALGTDSILALGDNLRLNPVVIRSDLGEFREALARGDRQSVVALYQGPFLDGFFVPDVPEFERWAEAERERCVHEFAQSLQALAEERMKEGDLPLAVECWRRLTAHDPYSSRVALRLMQALEAAGDPGGALQHARAHGALLRETLELEPDAEVVALAERLRSPAAAPTSGGGAGLSARPHTSRTAPNAEAAPPPPVEGEILAEGARQGFADPRAAGGDRTPLPHSSTPLRAAHRARAQRPHRRLAWAAVLLLSMAVMGAAVFVRALQTTRSERVFVAVFDNQTGDPSMDPLGRMAADWIARGLLQTGSVEVVAPSERSHAQGAGDRGIRALAREAGARTVVSGAYYREGDILHFQVKISDAVRGRLLQTLEPLGVPSDSATAGVELMREQVAAALAARFDWSQELREITTRSRPPIYAAYAAYVEGIELFGVQPDRAIERFDRAWALDSTFYSARLFSILTNTQFGNPARADSMIQSLAPLWDALSPFERAFLERSRAELSGDRGTALRAARRMAELAPGSQFIIGHAAQAVWANRPREAADALRRLDPKLGLVPGHAREDFLTVARHMLGEHRLELQGARQARLQHPELRTVAREVRALAALGRVDEVERLLRESLSLPPHAGWTSGEVLRNAAAELRAHGHGDAAARAFEQALAWYESRPAEERPRHRLGAAHTLYEAERWDEARSLFEELATEQPQNVHVLGRLGTLAARRGERAEAERISTRLSSSSRLYLRGAHTLWRARIAAQLGEREQALHLLREAFTQGHPYGLWLHTDPDLGPLRDLSAFRELVRPKG
jgi:DNA-binding SARP family transcriptional activator/TolB-like protein